MSYDQVMMLVTKYVMSHPYATAVLAAVAMMAVVKMVKDILTSVVEVVKAPFDLVSAVVTGVYTMVMVVFRGYKCCVVEKEKCKEKCLEENKGMCDKVVVQG